MPRGTRSSGYPIRQRTSSPNRAWAGFSSATAVTVAATSKVLIATATPLNLGIDLTILRTRGWLCYFAGTPTADRFISGAFGIMIVKDLAAAAGVASLPGPATDASDDSWFVHEWFISQLEFGTAVGMEPNFGNSRSFDSKAKRKIEEGEVAVAVVENLTGSGISFGVNFRCLDMIRGTR